jgi:SAM-dependent methyltransferase
MEGMIFAKLRQAILRRTIPARFIDFNQIFPVSKKFGFDRGTPIDRYYIDAFLGKHFRMIRGRILEIGESYYGRRHGGDQVDAIDVLHTDASNKAATIIGDLCDPSTLPDNAFDCFVCTQTFNFIFNVRDAITGAHHLLKPGGVLLATVAGICQISRYDMERWGDYWRFTTASIEKLFRPVFEESLEIESYGNVLAATAFLQGMAVEDLPTPSLLDISDPDYQVLIAFVARKSS